MTTFDVCDISQTVYLVEAQSFYFPGEYYPLIGFKTEQAAQNWIANRPQEEAGQHRITTVALLLK
jgi:hypothetical protein